MSDKTELKAGAAETVITPKVVLKSLADVNWIGEVGDGYYTPKEGELIPLYGDLYARVLVLEDNEGSLAIVTLDMTEISYERTDVLLQSIHQATGIPKENIVINCSHTHNEPDESDPNIKEAPSFESELAGHLAAITKNAIDNLQPATIHVGREPVQIAYNRRFMKDDGEITMAPNPKGPIVPWVDVLGAYGSSGERIGVLFSYAAHPVIIMDFDHAPSHVQTVVGPDYPGFAIGHLRGLLGENGEAEGVFMFAQGCSANINGFPLRGGFGACDAAGLSLAAAVKRAMGEFETVPPTPLKSQSMTLSLPLQRPTVKLCKQLLVEEPGSLHYQRLLERAENDVRESIPLPMRAFAVGDELCILSLPGEMFAEYQLFADEISPFKHTLVFGYTNGNSGYIATKKDYDLGLAGGYEASLKHRLPPEPSVEGHIQEGITRLLSELKYANN
ncbi:MAG: hypothetical protein OXN17_14990 [Candidatus Poribacteria bacterium]|nr:hypothetical protein [Candidatus Poribacteria bacterium]MDE0506579.1 hypothetical protein [Candidatus Poribacteria bacterium]